MNSDLQTVIKPALVMHPVLLICYEATEGRYILMKNDITGEESCNLQAEFQKFLFVYHHMITNFSCLLMSFKTALHCDMSTHQPKCQDTMRPET